MFHSYSYEALYTYFGLQMEIFLLETRKFCILHSQDTLGGEIFTLRVQSCNSAASKRANNKIGFRHPRLGAYVARDSEG